MRRRRIRRNLVKGPILIAAVSALDSLDERPRSPSRISRVVASRGQYTDGAASAGSAISIATFVIDVP